MHAPPDYPPHDGLADVSELRTITPAVRAALAVLSVDAPGDRVRLTLGQWRVVEKIAARLADVRDR
jgi:hypothetical protein